MKTVSWSALATLLGILLTGGGALLGARASIAEDVERAVTRIDGALAREREVVSAVYATKQELAEVNASARELRVAIEALTAELRQQRPERRGR